MRIFFDAKKTKELQDALVEKWFEVSKYGGDITLPTYGFLVESPTYIAFHSLSWNGR